jgi:hypothetical protein
LRELVIINSIFERGRYVLLTNHIIKPHGPVFPRRDNKIFHAMRKIKKFKAYLSAAEKVSLIITLD